MDQRDLVERAGRGDHDAFGALVGTTIAGLEAVARLILRDHELARDAVQDAYIKAWRDLPGLRDPERFEAWLHRLLVNTCLDTLRRRRRRPMEVELVPIAPPSVGDETGWVADRDQLERGFRGLDPDQRAVLVLHYYVGMTVPMVAETLGVPLGTAQSRLGRALATLRTALGPEFDTDTSPSSGEGSHEPHRPPRARADRVVRRDRRAADPRLDRGHPRPDRDHPPASALVVPGTLAACGRVRGCRGSPGRFRGGRSPCSRWSSCSPRRPPCTWAAGRGSRHRSARRRTASWRMPRTATSGPSTRSPGSGMRS